MAQVVLNPRVQDEIVRLARVKQVDVKLLEEFAYFIVQSTEQKSRQEEKSLKTDDLKKSICKRFNVKNTNELKKSGAFKMATDGMEKLDFRLKSTWETLYRKFIGILPQENHQQGYGCINGINIFQYFKPWQVLGLDSKTATKDDIKASYYKLSKIYHPDNPETGDREVFEKSRLCIRVLLLDFNYVF